MEFGDSLKVAEDRETLKGIVATSSVVSRRPSVLRDWEMGERNEISQISCLQLLE